MNRNVRYLIVWDQEVEEGAANEKTELDNQILEQINENLKNVNKTLEALEKREEEREEKEAQEQKEKEEQEKEAQNVLRSGSSGESGSSGASASTSSIVVSDPSADVHLYLSSEVQNADINDLYSIALSTRNIVLLFCLIFLFMRLFGALKNVIYRIMDSKS